MKNLIVELVNTKAELLTYVLLPTKVGSDALITEDAQYIMKTSRERFLRYVNYIGRLSMSELREDLISLQREYNKEIMEYISEDRTISILIERKNHVVRLIEHFLPIMDQIEEEIKQATLTF